MILPRLYPILDTSRPIDAVDAAKALQDGGATWVQIRHKSQWTSDFFRAAERIASLGLHLIVNDRADIAKMIGAGVHVGQSDLSPRDARAIAGDATVGYSTHNQVQLTAAAEEPIDYVALGPVFGTTSKENPDPIVGLEALREMAHLAVHPLVAIGGITRVNARAVLMAGADSVAVIGDLYPDPLTPATLRNRMEEWQRLLQS